MKMDEEDRETVKKETKGEYPNGQNTSNYNDQISGGDDSHNIER